ncbi:MAG: carbohydrate-binding family 9-like protein [Verrucomicrobiae bacterium]|nr:carbohydrate-binding family 9-like protein [Verrucomicrobiae bacterium]
MRGLFIRFFFFAVTPLAALVHARAADSYEIARTADFTITGDGSASNWEAANWLSMPPFEDSSLDYETKVKLLYSDSGIYALFYCEDRRLTSAMTEDFDKLWTEDVVEVFLWPDERMPVYFEHELSPLNRELVLLVPNYGGRFFGWIPWQYEGERLIQHKTSVTGGRLESMATVKAWTGEIFFPYKIFSPMLDRTPQSGDRWRGNFYRMDYDEGRGRWSWMKTEKGFHEYEKFGALLFK